jgi:hypothetical protein
MKAQPGKGNNKTATQQLQPQNRVEETISTASTLNMNPALDSMLERLSIATVWNQDRSGVQNRINSRNRDDDNDDDGNDSDDYEASQSAWDCRACTYVNHGGTRCAICETRR